MKSHPAPIERKQLLIKILIIGCILAAGAIIAVYLFGFEALKAKVEHEKDVGLVALQRAGPWAFFSAMAFLPAVGAPISPFSVAAGPAFSATLGIWGVVAAGVLAIGINIVLTYWLARYAFRPAFKRLVERLGYRVPELDDTEMTELILFFRVTPGTPFFIQNYLLGLANAPFVKYLVISCVSQWAYAVVMIVFGDALLAGKGKMVLYALGLLVALGAATHFVRRHLANRKKAA